MLIFALSMQDGTFEVMIDNAARMLLGHVQIQHPEYQDDPRLEYTLEHVAEVTAAAKMEQAVGVVSPRTQAFALVSAGERSFGGQIMGVDPVLEAAWSTLPGMADAGRYLTGPGEAFVGSVLARNLGVGVGSELVLLGTAREGGVAAAVAEVVGTFTTGQPELDRALVQIPIDDFRQGWELGPDEAHVLIVLTESVAASDGVAARLGGDGWRALGWRELMPEAEQTINLKSIGAYLFFALISIIVTFSVVNTFMMMVFERTPEFGMLMAIGMKPGAIMRQLQLEALWLSLLGVGLGVLVSLAIIVPLSRVGIPLPAEAAELLQRYNMPDRMYPQFSTNALWMATVIMFLGTQIAAFIPGLRIRRMRPVTALRARE
jgi:ABC-type lipoprotein release transport system permease subunit